MKCPSCDSTRVYPSRLRGFLEVLRHRLTDRQPYRCRDCGWRRWLAIEIVPIQPDVRPDDLRTGGPPNPVAGGELDPLDPGQGRV
jgi:hypothetical protein